MISEHTDKNNQVVIFNDNNFLLIKSITQSRNVPQKIDNNIYGI